MNTPEASKCHGRRLRKPLAMLCQDTSKSREFTKRNQRESEGRRHELMEAGRVLTEVIPDLSFT